MDAEKSPVITSTETQTSSSSAPHPSSTTLLPPPVPHTPTPALPVVLEAEGEKTREAGRSPPPSPSVTRVSRVREGDDVVTRRETETTQTLCDKVVTTTETESTKTLADGTIVRKKSIRRRVSQKSEEPPTVAELTGRRFGLETEQYDAIVQRVLGEPQYRGAVEMLQERLKMLRMMQEDCQAMVDQWEDERQQRNYRRQLRSVQLAVGLASFFVFPLLGWICVRG